MKKFIIAGMAVAMLVIPSIASADVQRYQEQTGTLTTHVCLRRPLVRPHLQGHDQPV